MHHICHTKHAMLGVYIYIYTWHCICAWYEPIYIIYIYIMYISVFFADCALLPLSQTGLESMINTSWSKRGEDEQSNQFNGGRQAAGCQMPVRGWGPSSAGDVRHHIGCAQPWCAGDGARTQKFPQNGLPLVEWWAWKKESWMVWSQGMSQHVTRDKMG